MNFGKTFFFVVGFFCSVFFSPSIGKFSEYFAHAQSNPSVKKKRIPFFQNSLQEAVINQIYCCHLTSTILKYLQ